MNLKPLNHLDKFILFRHTILMKCTIEQIETGYLIKDESNKVYAINGLHGITVILKKIFEQPGSTLVKNDKGAFSLIPDLRKGNQDRNPVNDDHRA